MVIRKIQIIKYGQNRPLDSISLSMVSVFKIRSIARIKTNGDSKHPCLTLYLIISYNKMSAHIRNLIKKIMSLYNRFYFPELKAMQNITLQKKYYC